MDYSQHSIYFLVVRIISYCCHNKIILCGIRHTEALVVDVCITSSLVFAPASKTIHTDVLCIARAWSKGYPCCSKSVASFQSRVCDPLFDFFLPPLARFSTVWRSRASLVFLEDLSGGAPNVHFHVGSLILELMLAIDRSLSSIHDL